MPKYYMPYDLHCICTVYKQVYSKQFLNFLFEYVVDVHCCPTMQCMGKKKVELLTAAEKLKNKLQMLVKRLQKQKVLN